jgi:hypothetical protein
MCTLGLILGQSSRFPAIVAANRDEAEDRPSRAPHLWSERSPLVVAGSDERAGGTWLGVNENGLVVGLTNLWQGQPADPALASRGDIVLALLGTASLEQASRLLTRQDPLATNAFLCVVLDAAGRAFYAHSEDALEQHRIDAGIHAFGNRPPVERPAKLGAAQQRMQEAWSNRGGDGGGEILEALRPPLAHHTGDRGPRESVCVHGRHGFGTVSSTLLLLGVNGERSRLYHVEGPPCQAAFTDLSSELDSLFSATMS